MESKIVKFIEAETKIVLARASIGGHGEVIVKEYKVSVMQDKLKRSTIPHISDS